MSTTGAIILAQPPQRAILQPSIHARGARNYVYMGAMDDYHAPGALLRSGETRCAVDAAWLVQKVLGLPRHAPSMWPGVPGARERAIAYGAHVGLMGKQQEGAAFLAERDYAVLADAMGCVAGDSLIRIHNDGKTQIPMRALHVLFHSGVASLGRSLVDIRILSLVEEVTAPNPRQVLSRIKDVIFRGVRPVVRVTTTTGASLVVTPDHEIGLMRDVSSPLTWSAAGLLQAGNSDTTAGVVTRVEPAGETDVYDIVCEDPHRNFFANDFLVHNCGKTGEALIAAESRLSLGYIPTPTTPVVLVLAPALAKRHWQREIKKWTGHDAEILEGLAPGEIPATRYVIANYDILSGAHRKDPAGVVHSVAHLAGWGSVLAGRFLLAILDEAHQLRGRSSLRSKAVRAVCKGIPVVWGLSGTPIPNYVRDLWGLWDIVSGGLAGTYWDFVRAYSDGQQGQYGFNDKGSSRTDELAGRLTFFMLGRSKEVMGLELPEKRREIYKIDVTVSAPTVHEGHVAMSKSGFVAKALRITARAKRSAVIQHAVEALEAGQKVVVFVYMREQADEVAKGIKAKVDCHVACVHGDMTPDGRDAQATVFREVASPACFVATIDAVGLAISLVGADLVLYGDLVPEPHKLLQTEARCHRHGSTNRVLVRYLIGIGTLDEAVAESVIEKLSTIEQALGGEADQGELQVMLGGRTDESIVDSLFEKLKQLSAGAE